VLQLCGIRQQGPATHPLSEDPPRNAPPMLRHLEVPPSWLARAKADNGLLDPALASGSEKTKGVKQHGVRVGNWLLRD
jgi:hypothetical protein